jgi:hypothetical protein
MPSPRIYPSNSRQQPHLASCEPRVDAIAIILEFVRPFRPRGRRFNQQRKLWLNELGQARVSGGIGHWRPR